MPGRKRWKYKSKSRDLGREEEKRGGRERIERRNEETSTTRETDPAGEAYIIRPFEVNRVVGVESGEGSGRDCSDPFIFTRETGRGNTF